MISLSFDRGCTQNAFSACDVAYGLFAGPDRDERRALRRAELAERRFRQEKGYCGESVWSRLLHALH